jgi:hypothetical protein
MDTIFRKQRGKIQVSVPTRLRHCPTKSEILSRRPPCLGVVLTTTTRAKQAVFVHIAMLPNDLQKFKCHSCHAAFALTQ